MTEDAQGPVGQRIREVRLTHGWTQKELGERVLRELDETVTDRAKDSMQSNISRYERGTRQRQRPDRDELRAIARALELEDENELVVLAVSDYWDADPERAKLYLLLESLSDEEVRAALDRWS